MPNYWNKTVTVFNRYEDTITGQIIWYKHILSGVFVKRTNVAVTVANVRMQSDDNIVRIPLQTNYKNPYLWSLSQDKQDYITLQTDDIIIYGEVEDTIDEYTAGQRSTDIVEKYRAMGVMRIKSVNINTDLPNKHYLVRGE